MESNNQSKLALLRATKDEELNKAMNIITNELNAVDIEGLQQHLRTIGLNAATVQTIDMATV